MYKEKQTCQNEICSGLPYSFKVCLGNFPALFLPRTVGFYVETLGIYLGSLGKLT